MIELADHQIEAINKLNNGNILKGGVGTGKSRTALAYYYFKECKGSDNLNGFGNYIPMKNPLDLYIITTARKRDNCEWEDECIPFKLFKDSCNNPNRTKLVIDSWNNIEKYINVSNSFFIFDEQRASGSGKWSKTFIKIARKNKWILLSATPGDNWMNYAPVFIANNFYKNRTHFICEHVTQNPYRNYFSVMRYENVDVLQKLRNQIVVDMPYQKPTISHPLYIKCSYDKDLYDKTNKNRWNYFDDEPLQGISDTLYLLRKISNMHESRIEAIDNIRKTHKRNIVFYNFDFELDMLKEYCLNNNILFGELNGHKHDSVPNEKDWMYLVQYYSGAEAWNCIKTDNIIFYSQNYSYKTTVQAAGRIDRLNTPYKDLYYFYLISDSIIDKQIKACLANKKDFNESDAEKWLA